MQAETEIHAAEESMMQAEEDIAASNERIEEMKGTASEVLLYLQQMQTINQATGGQYQYSLDPTSMAGYIQDGQIQPYLIFNSIYQEELEAYANQYAQELNRQEQDLEQEKLTLETQIKAIQAEYEAVEQQEGDNIQSDAIKLS